MSMEIVAVIVVSLMGIVLFIASRRPDFRVERSITVGAPAPIVFTQVNDFHKWAAWSPWEKVDPGMKRTYEGAAAGVGAVYSWEGNKKVGAGRMTVEESKPGVLVRLKLEFFRPFKNTNMAEFAFKAEGNQTTVTWSMTGQLNFIMKGMGMIMSMDKMIGGEFAKGLSQLKTVSEAAK